MLRPSRRRSPNSRWLPMSKPISPRAISLMKVSSSASSRGTTLRNEVPRSTPMTIKPTTWGMPTRWNSLLPRNDTAMIRPMTVRMFGS